MSAREIRIERARSHNLREVSCEVPIGALTVVTGPSGSGKSTLAFDTLYAEGQRRYVTSLSTYARQFLERLPRPDVDSISHVPPAIAIEQRNGVTGARSTVGTSTEIQDHLRLLYARIGETICCGAVVEAGTVESVVRSVLERFDGRRILVGTALPEGGPAGALRDRLLQEGYGRLITPTFEVRDAEDLGARAFARERKQARSLIDRLVPHASERSRLAEAVARGFERGHGELVVIAPGEAETARYFEGRTCPTCATRHPAPEPGLFSFNHALGACESCEGFGRVAALDTDRLVPDPTRTLAGEAIAPFASPSGRGCQHDLLEACGEAGVPTDVAWEALGPEDRAFVIDGDDDAWYGVRGFFDWLAGRRYKVQARVMIARYRRFDPCPDCRGTRLRPAALAVEVAGEHIGAVSSYTLGRLAEWVDALPLDARARERGGRIVAGLRERIATANRVGLDYLALDRQVRTLSGGEAQRIQLATALGGSLTSSLYVLDEPTVGLHARDVARLLSVIEGIRDQGNTVVVVEHAPEVVCAADHVIDLGPGAGRHGGRVMAEGPVAEIRAADSATGRVLRGELARQPRARRKPWGALQVTGASARNLADLSLAIPLGNLVVVTGVSGAGKSTLVRSCVVGGLRGEPDRGACEKIEGGERLTDVIVVEPTPPGRSLRSNPATVSKAFDPIRKLFAETREAKSLGLSPGWFSFNVAGGRCEQCEGTGQTVIDMQFLEDVRVPCEACEGRRYKEEALAIRVHDRTIVDVLETTIEEARELFAEEPRVVARLEPFVRVGLGYLTLAQPLTTLSGGELQRLRLAQALAEDKPGSLYVLDEPTTGLHPVEVEHLIGCLDGLLDAGSAVIVVEHNLELIRQADHVIDLGPEGGPGGGRIVAEGPPEAILAQPGSRTGAALHRDPLAGSAAGS